jgi:putative tricarboxylic transport membrane protein
MVMAAYICVESIRLGPGSLSTPGSGLFPLGCGLIIEILGIIAFIRTFKGMAEPKKVLWEQDTHWGKLICMLTSIIGYAFLVDPLGFVLVTFIWLGFVCVGVGKMRWKWAVFTSAVTTSLCYILFVHYLGVRLPPGIFGF